MSDWYCEEVLNGRRAIGVVRETETILAFHHTRPSYADAHVVVIPKKHVPSLLSAEADGLLADLLSVVRAVAADVLESQGAARVITNLGQYQDSKHLHVHVVCGQRIDDPVEIRSNEWRPYLPGPERS